MDRARLLGTALLAVIGAAIMGAGPLHVARAQTSPASPEPGLAVASIPLFEHLAADGVRLQSYAASISLTASLHTFIFTFHFRRSGTISFAQPDKLSVAIQSVPQRYTHVLEEIGTPRSWPLIDDLHVVRVRTSGGQTSYDLAGAPREPCDVERVTMHVSDETVPIEAQWVLHGGWTIAATIELEDVDGFLVPRVEHADIVGHGYRIHADISYGGYTFEDVAYLR